MATPGFIQRAYIAFFNRPADKAGFDYWNTFVGSDQVLIDQFAGSAEYLSDFASKSYREVIEIIYKNLFNRAPDAEGWDYWENAMEQGWVTVGFAAYEILGGAQGTDSTIITNKATAAQTFTSALNTEPRADAYAKAGDNGVGHLAKNWLADVSYTSASVSTANAALNDLLAALVSANTTIIPPPGTDPIELTHYYSSSSDATITLSTEDHVNDTIKLSGFNNGKLSVKYFGVGDDIIDFTAYGAKWLGAAILSSSGYAVTMTYAPISITSRWQAESAFPSSSLSVGDKYITLVRDNSVPDALRYTYKIELWTVKGSMADAYYGGAMTMFEVPDTPPQLIGHIDLGAELTASLVSDFVF